jgi:hypothetical protein
MQFFSNSILEQQVLKNPKLVHPYR